MIHSIGSNKKVYEKILYDNYWKFCVLEKGDVKAIFDGFPVSPFHFISARHSLDPYINWKEVNKALKDGKEISTFDVSEEVEIFAIFVSKYEEKILNDIMKKIYDKKERKKELKCFFRIYTQRGRCFELTPLVLTGVKFSRLHFPKGNFSMYLEKTPVPDFMFFSSEREMKDDLSLGSILIPYKEDCESAFFFSNSDKSLSLSDKPLLFGKKDFEFEKKIDVKPVKSKKLTIKKMKVEMGVENGSEETLASVPSNGLSNFDSDDYIRVKAVSFPQREIRFGVPLDGGILRTGAILISEVEEFYKFFLCGISKKVPYFLEICKESKFHEILTSQQLLELSKERDKQKKLLNKVRERLKELNIKINEGAFGIMMEERSKFRRMYEFSHMDLMGTEFALRFDKLRYILEDMKGKEKLYFAEDIMKKFMERDELLKFENGIKRGDKLLRTELEEKLKNFPLIRMCYDIDYLTKRYPKNMSVIFQGIAGPGVSGCSVLPFDPKRVSVDDSLHLNLGVVIKGPHLHKKLLKDVLYLERADVIVVLRWRGKLLRCYESLSHDKAGGNVVSYMKKIFRDSKIPALQRKLQLLENYFPEKK